MSLDVKIMNSEEAMIFKIEVDEFEDHSKLVRTQEEKDEIRVNSELFD